MRILLLGSTGQVGSEVRGQLESLVNLDGFAHEINFAGRSEVDVSDYLALQEFLENQRPAWVINATAYTLVDKAEAEIELAYQINENAVRCIAEYCKTHGASLFHISTDYVFDGLGAIPFRETCLVSPLSVYGASKLAGEEAARKTLPRHLILRTAWVFGSKGNNFVKTMLRLAQSKTEIGVVGDQFGAPTSARSIAKTIVTLVSQMLDAEDDDPRWGTYHYSGHPYVCWADFACEIFRQATAKAIIECPPAINVLGTDEYPTPANRPVNSRLDCSKICDVFGVEPDNWGHSLGLMLDEMREVAAK